MIVSSRPTAGPRLCRVLAAILLLVGVVPTLCRAGSEQSSGYFFLSARPTDEGKRLLERDRKAVDEKKVRLKPEYYTTTIHGPFRSRFEARRALRALRREAPETTYYTRIYKL
jgi:hypothetical protein